MIPAALHGVVSVHSGKIYQRGWESLWYKRDIYFPASWHFQEVMEAFFLLLKYCFSKCQWWESSLCLQFCSVMSSSHTMIDCFNWGSAAFSLGQAGGWTQPLLGIIGIYWIFGIVSPWEGCPALARVSPHPWGGDTWGQGSAGRAGLDAVRGFSKLPFPDSQIWNHKQQPRPCLWSGDSSGWAWAGDLGVGIRVCKCKQGYCK